MSLFPAYSERVESSSEREVTNSTMLFPSCSNQPSSSQQNPSSADKTRSDSKWLENRSFASSNTKETRGEKHYDSPEKEIGYIRSSNSDPRLKSRRSDSRKRHRSRSKSRERRRHETKKKKRKHRKSRSTSRETKEQSLIQKPLQTEKWDFSNTKTNHSAVRPSHTTDRKRELENLQFNSVYKRQVAKFVYSKGRQNLLLGSRFLNQDIFQMEKYKTKDRYFNGKKRRRPKVERTNSIGGSKYPDFPLEDVVEIGSEPMIDENGDELFYDPKIQMYRKKIEEPQSDISISRSDRDKQKLRIQQGLHENPQNVQLWIEFLKFEEENSSSSGKSKVTDLAMLERKMAIIDKAIAANPSSPKLKIMRIQIGKEGLWERDQIKQEWSKLEFNHVNQPEIWREQIKYFMENFSSFKVTKLCAMFDRALEKFHSVVLGKLLTHKPPPRAERFLLECLVWKANFLSQNGFTEKALATFQAAVEFNFFQPENVALHGSIEKRVFFEPFWDSGLPRIGDEGSEGWSRGKNADQIGKEDENEFNEAENLLCRQNATLPDGKLWKMAEELREEFQWYPWRSSEEPEDPDRIILFDDIRGALIEFKDDHNRFMLIVSFLKFLGVSLIPFHDNSTGFGSCDSQQEREMVEHFQSLPQFPSLRHKDCDSMIDRIFAKVESEIFPSDPYRTYFACSRLHHAAVSLKRRTDLSEKEKLRKFKKAAKEQLQKNQNRNSLLLYTVYAEEMLQFSHSTAISEALTIAKTALSMAVSLLSSTEEEDDSGSIAVLKLVNIVVKGQGTSLNIITNYLSRFFTTGATIEASSLQDRCISSTEILKAKRFAQEKLEAFRDSHSYEDGFNSSSYCGTPLTLLSSLAAWFYYASSEGSMQGLTAGEKVFQESAERIIMEQKNLDDDQGLQLGFLTQDLVALLEARVEFVRSYVNSSPLAAVTEIRKTLEDATSLVPSEPMFWNELVRLSSQGFRLVQFRRFLNSLRDHSLSLASELGAIRAEFDRYFWLIECQETSKHPQVHSLRKVLDSATERMPNRPLLWRLYMKFEALTSNETNRCKQIFFKAIKSCPWSKEIYSDFIDLAPEETEMVVDLMIEKELRVRIPLEELEILKEAATQNDETQE